MTCAKKQVQCTIHTAQGVAVGTNACANPQEVCPRGPYEGYEKCVTICRQAGHAEDIALLDAKQKGLDLTGAVAVLYGHTHYCQACQEKLFDAGVTSLRRAPVPGTEFQA